MGRTESQNVLETWNSKLAEIWQLITQSPETFKGGTIWDVIVNIHGAVQAIGLALLVILTLWNVVRTAGSYVELKRPEHVFKLFVRFILTKYSIAVAWKLVNGIFMVAGALTTRAFTASGLTDGNAWAGITAPNFDDTGILEIITNLMAVINPLSQVPALLLGLIGFIVAVVLSVTLLLTVIGRFFKIYCASRSAVFH